MLLQESWLARDALWIAVVAGIYALAVIAATLGVNSYFSQTWDVRTFVQAAGSFLNGTDWTGLYQQSRADQYWPYAYPPLHALVLAPLLAFAGSVPSWLLARLPPLAADIGVGLLLYLIVANKTQNTLYARLALFVWLLNPVTFYDTAVQGHFEAEWLFFVVLAYFLAEQRRGILFPTLALACAFLFKQVAILFALPYWTKLIFANGPERGLRRWTPFASSLAMFTLLVTGASLPFLLHSGDYIYMNLQYVQDVPLQTQSWLVGVAAILGPQTFLLEYSGLLVLLCASAISFFTARRGAGLYLAGMLIALAFFILSKKVVGYYYVMLLPFALVTLLPARRFSWLTIIVLSAAWISLSPYFASWAGPEHWWVYATLGTMNSILWLALFLAAWRAPESPIRKGNVPAMHAMAFVSAALFLEWVAAALVQPFILNPTSPIRFPIFPIGLELNVLAAGLVFAGLVLAGFFVAAAYTRSLTGQAGLPGRFPALSFALMPLPFLTFALTKESTAVLEWLMKTMGI